MNRLYETIWVICHPHFWVMNNPYCEEWDKMFMDLVENGKIESIDRYDVTIDGVKIWIANYPYSCCTHGDVRPSRVNIYLGMKKIKTQQYRLLRVRARNHLKVVK